MKNFEKVRVLTTFNRKKTLEKSGVAEIEIYIYFSRKERKYISLKKCTEAEWKKFQGSKEDQTVINNYITILNNISSAGEEVNVENFNKRIGYVRNDSENLLQKKYDKMKSSTTGFIDFIMDSITRENLRPATITRRNVVLKSLKEFKKLKRMSDLTRINLLAYDEWLREGNIRTDATIHNYHKTLKMYTRMAKERDLIEKDPYDLCHFSRGKSKERQPLTEDELLAIRNLKNLGIHERRVRDMFIFAAYTGLAYVDLMAFDFKTMTEKYGDSYYIDGNRVKTGSNYFTPILPPAMEILKRNNYELPHMSNQKVNDGLKVLKGLAKITKPVSFHVARHSFATLTLAHDVPIENVARMLGHKDIKTTQIYSKILKSTVQRHGNTLAQVIK